LVELNADLQTRLKRNVHPNRLENKPSKRNLENSKRALLQSAKDHRTSAREDEYSNKSIFKINNELKTAEETALLIQKTFAL